MDATYRTLKKRTHQIAAEYPDPDFYRRHSRESDYSTGFFNNNKLISSIRAVVAGPLSENLGHGFEHAAKVTVDAGTLMLIEGKLSGCSKFHLDRQLLLVQSAGLLHDISRTEENHAQKGAKKAREYLLDYSFTDLERDDICMAIHNHEAFKETVSPPTRMGTLISDCLYDADKFRWGADNLSHTLWDMLHFGKVPVSDFVAHYPNGMETLARIRDTFRTRTGKKYGPDFIDIGLAIGKKLHRVIETELHLE